MVCIYVPCLRKNSLKQQNPYIEEGVHKNVDLRSVAKILQPRTDVLTTIPEAIDFIDELPEYDNAMYIHKKMKTT